MPAMVPEAASQPIASFAPSHMSNAVDMWERAMLATGAAWSSECLRPLIYLFLILDQ
jgi:hypothetical protein